MQPRWALRQSIWCWTWGLLYCRMSIAGGAAWGGLSPLLLSLGVYQDLSEPIQTSFQDPTRGRVSLCDPRMTLCPEGCTWHVLLEGLCLCISPGLPQLGQTSPRAALWCCVGQVGVLCPVGHSELTPGVERTRTEPWPQSPAADGTAGARPQHPGEHGRRHPRVGRAAQAGRRAQTHFAFCSG